MNVTTTWAFAAVAAAAAVLGAVAGAQASWARPQIGMAWQWELTFGRIPDVTTPNVPVWNIDPEQLGADQIPALMSALHANNRYVICYVNVGSLDASASDAGAFKAVRPSIVGNPYPGWPGESFLDVRSEATRVLIQARLQRMASYGCHGIEPDNLDSYTYTNGFALTAADALDYMGWVAATAHGLGMAVGLKNAPDLVAPHNLASLFDFAVVESCAETGDCPKFAPFIQAGKPVFAAEYTDSGSGGCTTVASVSAACAATNAQDFDGIIKSCNLGPEWQACQTYDRTGNRVSPNAQATPVSGSAAPSSRAPVSSAAAPDAASNASSDTGSQAIPIVVLGPAGKRSNVSWTGPPSNVSRGAGAALGDPATGTGKGDTNPRGITGSKKGRSNVTAPNTSAGSGKRSNVSWTGPPSNVSQGAGATLGDPATGTGNGDTNPRGITGSKKGSSNVTGPSTSAGTVSNGSSTGRDPSTGTDRLVNAPSDPAHVAAHNANVGNSRAPSTWPSVLTPMNTALETPEAIVLFDDDPSI
ncbi:unnamed protein product (mitochondrion) [Plasmodiophora brassicae]|nr:unnamed protein product [Plasmodiophora brassicae]